MSKGSVILVGAGCGDYDLITLRGKSALESCDAVVYDSLIDSRLLDIVPRTAEKIPVGKRAGMHSEAQKNINQVLIDKALQGKTVVRLKGGDPFVFGRGGEEILALQNAQIPYAVVPGISSAVAVPELAGIPVTHRSMSRGFHVITGHTTEDWQPERMKVYAKLDGTLVFLMGLNHLQEIADALIQYGKSGDTPAAVISDGASERQQTIRGTLATITEKASQLPSPAVIVIGETALFDFSGTFHPVTVTVTGTQKFTDKVKTQLSSVGAKVSTIPYLEVQALSMDFNVLEEAHWLVFTSPTGVEVFWNHLVRVKTDIRTLFHLKFAVVGSGTAKALQKHGITADLVPEKYNARYLGEALVKRVQKEEKIILLRAENGTSALTNILDENKVDYQDIPIYQVSYKEIKVEKGINTDYLVFGSSYGVSSFFTNGFKISAQTKVICIGEPTANELKRYGAYRVITARESISSIVEIITGGTT
ncbi:uroporphyrinogen-III C-methyltransferase [Ruminococcus sp.]|uniref:uroporphyrinogen-III C-methyltransferase n=1 Tax=Ruminococcus sp. TaxID=41978 RepID=UPI002E78118F|nr:uroporphyrinogen-III C-methyltransferase [Ruminococcus sp.]MEE1264330.1 uroporphyrinogen-III C-methyltransferase [Ruminococcus sp.]